jgi:tripeptide aminopeptidase
MRQALDCFLRYVTVHTTSDEANLGKPSTEGQLVLLRQLAAELTDIGASAVRLDQSGCVMASVPATSAKRGVPTIGFIAHVDTSPEMPGSDVRPLVHRAYGGGPLVLADAPGAVLRPEEDPELSAQVGHDIVTASGTTLLGADDKAGVAEIMAAAAYLLAHPEVPHGLVRLAFTSDEEIGRGADQFDVERFGAACAYTLDGGAAGELEVESFAADAMTVTFHGFNTHPGYAKNRMVSAILMASAFVDALPKYFLTPERSDEYDGYVHPHQIDASVQRTAVRLLIRDFRVDGLKDKERGVEALAREIAARFSGPSTSTRAARVEIDVREQYRNMREVLDRHPHVVDYAAEAIRRAGLEVQSRPIRGGTDGSRLSFMGLPTPNLFAGQHNIHSRLEWTSRQDMDAAVRTIVELCRVFEERATPL